LNTFFAGAAVSLLSAAGCAGDDGAAFCSGPQPASKTTAAANMDDKTLVFIEFPS